MCSTPGICRTSSPTCNRCAPRRRRARKERQMGSVKYIAIAICLAAASVSAQVTADRLINAAREPQQWLTYSGSYNGQRFSPLDQIDATNVQRLALQWVFQTGVRGTHETTPLVVDDIMYLTAPQNHAYAIDVRSGRRAGRFYTIPGEGEPGNDTWKGDSWKRGGAPTWVTGTYDPELNTLYWGTGNPGPQMYGANRLGDNLYSDSLVALDPDTGKRKWHFQFTPHDTHDWDSVHVPVLIDEVIDGKQRKLVAVANRNGFFYLLDRTDGKYLLAKPYTKVTWAKEIGADGRPVVLPNTEPTPDGVVVCPGGIGGTNWHSPSYSPRTRLMYIFSKEMCTTFMADEKLEPP